MDSEAVLRAIEANPVISTRRVLIFPNPVGFITITTLAKSSGTIWLCLMLLKYHKFLYVHYYVSDEKNSKRRWLFYH